MWYLGSVPHQPDVSADVLANRSADIAGQR
jgi:hypothetical protein